jgi:hypothetical protein
MTSAFSLLRQAPQPTSQAIGRCVRGLYPAGLIEVQPPESFDAAITVATFANAELQLLFRYWQARRLGRNLPRRSDIDVLDLRACLGHLIVIDVGEEAHSLTYRLFGTRLSAALGFDPTGFDLMRAGLREDDPILRPYRTAAKLRAPVYCVNRMTSPSWDRRWERLVLPLSRDDQAVTQLLIGSYPLASD